MVKKINGRILILKGSSRINRKKWKQNKLIGPYNLTFPPCYSNIRYWKGGIQFD